MTEEPLFFLVNSYTTGLSPATMGYMVMLAMKNKGRMETGELGLRVRETGLLLPAGASARWTPDDNTEKNRRSK